MAADAVDHAAARRRRHVIGAVKLLLAMGILGFLFSQLRGEDTFQQLVEQPKRWPLLALAQVLALVGLSCNYLRWWVLVRALNLRFSVADAFRLGSLGLLLNQVSPGSVGGDLFKAVFIAREQPGKRTEAIASVLIDRIVGLFAMLVVATAGYGLALQSMPLSPFVHGLGRAVAALAACGVVGIALLMTPLFTGPKAKELARRLPGVGGTLERLIDAAAAYRHGRRYLFAGILFGCCTHTLFVVALWCVGRGLPFDAPQLLTVFVAGPLSLAAGAIPLVPGGLGTFEATMNYLYESVGCQTGVGLMVALTFRVMTYVMAGLGAIYYLNARRTMSQVLHEAEEIADEGEPATALLSTGEP
jgi:uncharacterized membrane protein YbhN (UPF0104 family)